MIKVCKNFNVVKHWEKIGFYLLLITAKSWYNFPDCLEQSLGGDTRILLITLRKTDY